MASVLEQLFEAADRMLEGDSSVDDNIENAINKDDEYPTKESDTNNLGGPDSLTVGPDVHQESGDSDMDSKNSSSSKDSFDFGNDKSTSSSSSSSKMEEGLTESEMLTADELFNIYSEAVTEVLRESKKAIASKYNEKKKLAKQFKAKKLAAKGKAAKKQKLEEAAMMGNFNSVMDQILSAR